MGTAGSRCCAGDPTRIWGSGSCVQLFKETSNFFPRQKCTILCKFAPSRSSNVIIHVDEEAVVSWFSNTWWTGAVCCGNAAPGYLNVQRVCISPCSLRAPDHVLISSYGSGCHLLGLSRNGTFAQLRVKCEIDGLSYAYYVSKNERGPGRIYSRQKQTILRIFLGDRPSWQAPFPTDFSKIMGASGYFGSYWEVKIWPTTLGPHRAVWEGLVVEVVRPIPHQGWHCARGKFIQGQIWQKNTFRNFGLPSQNKI